MSVEDLVPDGDLPDLKWFRFGKDLNVNPYLGIEVESINGKTKKFYHFENQSMGRLTNLEVRHDAAAFVARVMLEHGIEVTFGPAMEYLNRMDQRFTPHTGTEGYGIYVESEKRPKFSLKVLESEAYWREAEPQRFEKIYQRALEILPEG